MVAENTTILIMAAGTGGHIFPALSIAQKLSEQGVATEWLGTRNGMENELLVDSGIRLHPISVRGLRGKGIARLLLAPFMILVAVVQAMRVISRVQPNCVLGMGGFVSGPGGLATKIMGRPLLIHEQNAVAGVTNRILARIANRVFEAFPNTFPGRSDVIHTGNPVREDIASLRKPDDLYSNIARPLQVLVLGGSQGAAAINSVVPEVLANWQAQERPHVWHQTGRFSLSQTMDRYQSLGFEVTDKCRIEAFIDDMRSAYDWADLVICRSGASTVSELVVVGLPALLVPYPHHRDNQQTVNAQWLSQADAAQLIQQEDLTTVSLLNILRDLDSNREKLQHMSQQARSLAVRNASDIIAEQCLELAHV